MASTNKCTYCGKEFAKERTLQVHLCEPKRRYLQRDEKWVVNAFMVFQRFYQIHQHNSKTKTYDDFVKQLPNNAWITYVGRGKGSQTWPECGFYGMNKNHAMCVQFLKEFERFYEDAENGIFKLEEWHDSWIWDHVRHEFEKNGKAIFKDISNKEYNGKIFF